MWVEEDPFIGQSFDSHSKAEESKGFEIELSDGAKNDLGDYGGVVVSWCGILGGFGSLVLPVMFVGGTTQREN